MNHEGYTVYEPRLVNSVDGTKICTDAAGSRAADCPVIVLIHGFSAIKEAFDPMFEDLKWLHNAFLVRYDARGYGKSGKPLGDEAWESHCLAEDFEAVCKEFGVQRAFVLGWSLGGGQLADIATHATSVEIAGLINVEGFAYIDTTLIYRVAEPEAMRMLEILTQPPSVDAFQETALDFVRSWSSAMSEDLYRKMLEGILLQPRAVVGGLVTRKQDVKKYLREAREGKLDALVVRGGKDKLIRGEELEAVYKELGWKKYVLKHLDEADHLPWVSSPEAFCNAVLGWVGERHE